MGSGRKNRAEDGRKEVAGGPRETRWRRIGDGQ